MLATIRTDLLFGFLLALVVYLVTLLAQIHPPNETEQQHRPGNLVVSIAWPSGPDDVDLWMSAPGDKRVGYISKQGTVVALLRDDLGTTSDLTDANFESAYTRGIPDGEYGVNVHCYTCAGRVVVSVEIGIVGAHRLWTGTIEVGPRQERTAIRWKMRDGKFVPGSESFVFKAIRGE